MPRSIFVVNDFGHVNGGAAQVAVADAISLAQAGHNITFFCAVGPVAPELESAGVRVVCLQQREIAHNPNRLSAVSQGLWNNRAAIVLDQLLAEQLQMPIVHIHGWSKALSASVCATALARRAPIVVSLHDYFSACPNGGLYQYPSQKLCTLNAMSPSCIVCNCDSRSYSQKLYRVTRQVVQRFAGRLPGGVRHFVHHSRLVRTILMPYLPREAKFHLVPLTVDALPAPPAMLAENWDFVSIGRLSPEKGATLFAKAALRVGIRPVFVGDGRERDAVLAIASNAEITGWQERAGVRARLTRARALVFPSLCFETFGLSVAEALAHGVPTIVADRSAAAELVLEGETGLLFRTGDIGSLAACLEELKDVDRAASMGRCAYERYWKSPLTAERHLAAMLAVYERICA
jgi:glycosyltransferase involved in cell wall biosynthesis